MNKNNEPLFDNTASIQNWLRPALTPVLHNRDYQRLVYDLTKLDHDLKDSGLESKAMQFALENLPKDMSLWQRNRRAKFAVYALRVELLRPRCRCSAYPALRLFY